MKEGDNNTKFFYCVATAKRNINFISKVKIGGTWVEDEERIKQHVDGFFMDIFNDSGVVRPKLDGLDFKILFEDHRAWLERPFTKDEVKEVIWSTQDDKALGPDGFTMTFYKACWNFIKEDIMKMLEDFYYEGGPG